MSYASATTVPVARSKAEIEALLTKYGADEFVTGWSKHQLAARVMFCVNGDQFMLMVSMPGEDWAKRHRRKHPRRNPDGALAQEERRRWRVLALLCKAKLEAISLGDTTFRREFAADMVVSPGKTLGMLMADNPVANVPALLSGGER